MSVTLDETLINLSRRKPREDALTADALMAVNLFWRKHVRVPILARVFHASKNTLYYRALTGTADSYPNSLYSNQAREINETIDRMGEDEAWRRYVTDDMVAAVNAAMREEIDRRDKAA